VLADSFGRIATDLRVSVTDRCNLRCSYCMPAEGLDWLPGTALLTDGEVSRLISVAAARLGVTEVRFTGGEPLLRRGLAGLIASAAALRPRPEISLTTNGIGLARLAGPLAAAGLAPVKVNAVLMRGVNDHEAPGLLRFCLDHGYQLRFIEQMPLDAQHGWRRTDMVTADEILARLSAEFSLTPDDPAGRGSAPAETFLVDGGLGTVGVIGSVTRPFCGTCDRVRLTADGQVRNCLFATTETDLRTLLRNGATDDQLAAAWRGAVTTKLPGHGINNPGFLQPARPMSAIGG
jgi:cyclic pyranopterin phosphate synthase